MLFDALLKFLEILLLLALSTQETDDMCDGSQLFLLFVAYGAALLLLQTC